MGHLEGDAVDDAETALLPKSRGECNTCPPILHLMLGKPFFFEQGILTGVLVFGCSVFMLCEGNEFDKAAFLTHPQLLT